MGANRELLRQFWKLSFVRAALLSARFTAPSATGLQPRYVHIKFQTSDLELKRSPPPLNTRVDWTAARPSLSDGGDVSGCVCAAGEMLLSPRKGRGGWGRPGRRWPEAFQRSTERQSTPHRVAPPSAWPGRCPPRTREARCRYRNPPRTAPVPSHTKSICHQTQVSTRSITLSQPTTSLNG